MIEHPRQFARRTSLIIASVFLAASLALLPAALVAKSSESLRVRYKRPTSIPYPDTNAYSPAKAALGRALFFDPRFSGSMSRSCASCHEPNRAWSDGYAHAQGEGATTMVLRSPTLLNVAWSDRLGWDGKFRDIESVAFRAILAPSNMNMTEQTLLTRLQADPAYVVSFGEAFPDKAINRRNIEQALATFERAIVSPPSAFDRWIDGDESAIDASAKRGFALFEGKAKCAACHSGWAFTDGSFHDIGLTNDSERGRGQYFPTSVKLQHAFKTPTLRDVIERAPYMHDGSIATIRAVIEAYDRGGNNRVSQSDLIGPLHLDNAEKDDLIAFLGTLTSDPSRGHETDALKTTR